VGECLNFFSFYCWIFSPFFFPRGFVSQMIFVGEGIFFPPSGLEKVGGGDGSGIYSGIWMGFFFVALS